MDLKCHLKMYKQVFYCIVFLVIVTFITLYLNSPFKHVVSFRGLYLNRSQTQVWPATSTVTMSSQSPTSTPKAIVNTTGASTKEAPVENVLYLTTNFKGRLGNQLFIYASLVGIARANRRVPFVRNGGDLSSLFKMTHLKANIDSWKWSGKTETAYATFEPSFMNLPPTNCTIFGFFQCWRYFQHAQDEIRREFTFTEAVQKEVDAVLGTYRRRLDNHVIVGVHIRRGDFLHQHNAKYGYGVADKSYFDKAFSKMRSLLPNQNITFLVASDDLNWCKNNLKDPSVQMLPDSSAGNHFAILSSCDHVILAGGTFGWWMAWLANGITIYYVNFIAENSSLHIGFNPGDYYPPGWIGLDN
ncbi:galactoside 2-alpha-L-fucosyltransferase 2 [Biomphalaria glabrata]|nr:galactoside 2-alpha-L-fucosyltransferase 2 [Biomphalaria glabrata]